MEFFLEKPEDENNRDSLEEELLKIVEEVEEYEDTESEESGEKEEEYESKNEEVKVPSA